PVSLPCAAGAGEGWGGVLFAERPEKHPLPTSPLSATRPKGRSQAACLPPLRRQARGRAGEGCFLPGAPKSTPSQPPPCPLRGQRGGAERACLPPLRGCLSPSLAPQAQGRGGEGGFLPGAPKSTPSQPPPCPLRGQRGGAERACLPPLRGCLSPSLAPQAQG